MTARHWVVAAALAATSIGAGGFLLRDDVRVIDGDTIELRGERIRIWGIDAPDRPAAMKQAAGDYLARQIDREGGIVCATEPRENQAMRRERAPACRSSVASYRRIVTACHFKRSGDDVAGRMAAAGYAVDWRGFSGGYYAASADGARADRAGLWRSNRFQMEALADRRGDECHRSTRG